MLGNVFKENREAKGATASEAAIATRLKVQHIEALETEDFSTIAASAYAKGFIKLYAEYLEIDPAPLLADYEDNFMPKRRQPLLSDDEPAPQHNHTHDSGEKQSSSFPLPSLPSFKNIEWPFTFSKQVAISTVIAVLGIVLIVWLVSGLTSGNQSEESTAAASEVQDQKVVEVTLFRTHVLVKNPPEPFIDEYIDQ